MVSIDLPSAFFLARFTFENSTDAEFSSPMFAAMVANQRPARLGLSTLLRHAMSGPVKFEKEGGFKYHCKIHGNSMSGTMPRRASGQRSLVVIRLDLAG
jgi:hypothetical protein